MPKLLTVAEVALIFRRSNKTIYRWIDEGNVFFHVVRVADGYRIPQEEVERIINNIPQS